MSAVQRVFVICLFILNVTCLPAVVETPVGKIEGKTFTDSNNKTYYGFLAIPYALPPVGELRFAKPQPHPKFESTFDATKAIVACPQYGAFAFIDPSGKEDCLILNIYTDQLHSQEKKKVLVFIHGGGFLMGSTKGVVPGNFVTAHGIIVITVQYRLGIFGFLSTDDENAPGNFGLWDQILALKWVKHNIAAFGGDPDDITITGESAGGSSVSILSLSPATEGLFTKVYPHSGSATSLYAYAPTPHNDMLRFAKYTGCWDGDIEKRIPSSQSAEILKCLRKLPLPNIVSYADHTLVVPKFAPVVDGELIPKPANELLSDINYLKSVGYFDKSHLFAMNNNEASFMTNVIAMTETLAAQLYGGKTLESKTKAVADLNEMFWKYYVSFRLPRADESTVHEVKDWYTRRYGNDSLVQLVSDVTFLLPTHDAVDAASKGENVKVWLLSFDYYPRFMKGRFRGSTHAIDLVYWLDIPISRLETMINVGIKGRMDEEDKQLRKSFSTLIADFVKTGDPGSTLKSIMQEDWPVYDAQKAFYMSFKTYPNIEQRFTQDIKQFWMKKLKQ